MDPKCVYFFEKEVFKTITRMNINMILDYGYKSHSAYEAGFYNINLE